MYILHGSTEDKDKCAHKPKTTIPLTSSSTNRPPLDELVED